jgi:DNA polymerase III alpha subunit
MPLATADGLRKALSKKRPAKALAAYAEEFFAGALALGRSLETAKEVWHMVMSFAGYSFCKGHSCSYIQVAQQSGYLRAHYPAEFFAAVLANGGGFYAPFAYVAEARRAGLTVLPPDVNASQLRTTGKGGEIRIGLQFVKGLSAGASDRIIASRTAGRLDGSTAGHSGAFHSLADFRERTGIKPDDLRLLIKVGAFDSIASGKTRPEMLWELDASAGRLDGSTADERQLLAVQPSSRPVTLPEYSASRRRREECDLLDFATDCHPMELRQDDLRRFRLVPSTRLAEHVGRHVLAAGMLTTAKPVHTAKDEPMQFATFDDGHGLIETVLFPDVHRARGHVLFDQGPFIFRGKVEEEFGAIAITVTHLDRLDRMLNKVKHS